MDSFLDDFGSKVFSSKVMKEYLPTAIYESLKKSVELFLPLEPKIASMVATAMKNWAVENGATHYTHWFQPMTGITAGKHNSFINLENGSANLEFSGKELIKGEPDASSFPNGGLRNTFEARGYTTWDCTSPAFIKGKTLYIPTVFCSYNGEALDTKTPLLRSMEVISEQALKILRAFGDETTTHVIPTVGAEQEYFLVSRENYEKRLDLKICGRTLFGTRPPKGQEMDDHYCGRIRIKISDYMCSLDEELWKFGICSKTRHNEVAPAQHEMAPMFESCNVAADHNQLTMEIMRTVAKKKNLACLLHEKPFEYLNGSGKHNNWSLAKNDGYNLLSVGKTKKEHMQFLVFLCAVIRGVDKYAGLLRMSAASAGNDARLGGKEAPPTILSVFLGEHLSQILNYIKANGTFFDENLDDVLVTSVNKLVSFPKDDSDRNRTSPFAFTGNKFEFRMLGASASISLSTTIINLIVADSLEYFYEIIKNSENLEKATLAIVSETIENNGKIIFNGNSYAKSWQEEAGRRGLLNLKDSVDSAFEFVKDDNVKLFEHFNVLSRSECSARYEIMLNTYFDTIKIEADTMLEMTGKEILPALVEQIKSFSTSVANLKSCDIASAVMLESLKTLTVAFENITNSKSDLKAALDNIKNYGTNFEKAKFCRDEIVEKMKNLRMHVDGVEQLVSKKLWGMPYITDLLYKV